MVDAPEELLVSPSPGVALPHVRSLDLGEGEHLDLCWIPSGQCRIGSRDGDSDERPVRRLVIDRGFWLGRTVVTRGQWRVLHGSVPEPAFEGLEEPDRHPRVNVSWFEALEACARLQERFYPEIPAPCGPREALAQGEDCRAIQLGDGRGFRLPSELEWEYACRGAGRASRGLVERPFGDGDGALARSAWFEHNGGGRTHPVDADPLPGVVPHGLGLVQMIGNVWEWCLDLYRAERAGEVGATDVQRPHGCDPEDEASLSRSVDARDLVDRALRGELGINLKQWAIDLIALWKDQAAGISALQAQFDREYPPESVSRVFRGGSWVGSAGRCRSAYRDWRWPGDRGGSQGFRVALLPGPVVPGPAERGALLPAQP